MRIIMVMVHNCSITFTMQDCYKTTALFYTFISKEKKKNIFAHDESIFKNFYVYTD
jgi:hypothetical protein